MAWGEDMSWVAALQEGAPVLLETREGLYRHLVTRVTPKQIVVGEHWKFRREDGEEIGRTDKWYFRSLVEPTEANMQRYQAQSARNYLRGALWSKWSDEAVIAIAALTKKHQPKAKE